VARKTGGKIRRGTRQRLIPVSAKLLIICGVEMVAVCELIGLYSEVNQEIINRNLHTISPYYRAVTQHLREIKEKVAAISIQVPSPAGQKDAA
jgi:hypothetical protein